MKRRSVTVILATLAFALCRSASAEPRPSAPEPVPESRSPESEVAAVLPRAAQLPEDIPAWRVPPRSDAMQFPPATAAREPAAPPARQRQLRTVESALAAEESGEITQTQRDDIIATLREQRLFARGRAIREFREGFIDNRELEARLREIDRQFNGNAAGLP